MCANDVEVQPEQSARPLGHPSLLQRLVDVHAHPTDNDIEPSAVDALQMTLCAMSTNARDQELVERLAQQNPEHIVPCFGWHPWFSHHISIRPDVAKDEHYRLLLFPDESNASDEKKAALKRLVALLPDPIPLDTFLDSLRRRLGAFDNAMLGEVGVDRIFRIPFADYVAGGEIGRDRLSPFTVPVDHQLVILEAQLGVAVDMARNVSLHSVQASQITVDLLERMGKTHGDKWKSINIDLHSCTLSKDVLQRIMKLHSNVYCSLSTAINVNGRSDNWQKLAEACPDNRLLIESDFPYITDSQQRTWDMLILVADIKKWRVEDSWEEDAAEFGAVRILADNWTRFTRMKQ
ncbi:Metallo-dependent hydrolase [Exidia glandulosa HHB12029]|uniref:Metallo-dependent hydrolase n=1 Tax=Exidia glandulosa HHB12029 TaxID=1314781 RepID=A0A165BPD5_EXIGL|nr:Metallo-dependent hydrolase [Exidia glandulosa HHB12029]